MTRIEQIPAHDLNDLIQFVIRRAWMLKKENEGKEKSTVIRQDTECSCDFEKEVTLILTERNGKRI